MALAQANVVKTKYVTEVTPGTTPVTPVFTVLPVKSSNINGNKSTVTSAEIRSDRATADLITATGSTAGDIGFELSFTDYEPFIESALGGLASTAFSATGTTFAVAGSPTNTITDSGSGFIVNNLPVGAWVKLSGFGTAANNGIAKIVSVTTSVLTLSHITMVTEAAGATTTIKSKFIKNGAVKKTFTIEKHYPDLTTTFSNHVGMQVNTMTINAASGAIIEGTFGFMGRASAWAVASLGTDAAPLAATPIMSATSNVGVIYLDGAPLTSTYLKSVNLSTTNNTRQLDAIGNAYPVDVNLGSFGATLAIEAFFSDATIVSKFLAGTAISLSYSFTDSAGNVIVIDAPYAKLNQATVSAATLNADIMQSLNLTALLSPTQGFMLGISVLAA